jgi:drug/metabolite transporter (DMT)-like permease
VGLQGGGIGGILATGIVAAAGVVWGFYWLPVRALADLGLAGAWGTVAITLAAVLLLAPVAVLRRRQLRAADRRALAAVALGGAAFALYSVGFVYGRVAIIILLYFLTPVWSTLIGRFVMGWPVSRLRIGAIAVGLAGLGLMLGADGDLPLPRGAGEWMALVAGLMWSVATTGMVARPAVAAGEAAFVFAVGAAVLSLAVAVGAGPVLGPGAEHQGGAAAMEVNARAVAGLALATGGFWWGLSMAALMWATVRLEPARVGILLMTEVLVGALSAAVLADEHLAPLEFAGGALVLAAGVMEVWPARRRAGNA